MSDNFKMVLMVAAALVMFAFYVWLTPCPVCSLP